MLNDSVEDFFNYLQVERGLAENTLVSYRRDLTQYMDYLKTMVKKDDWEQVTRSDIIGFLYGLKDANKSTATISRHISSIRSFHQFLIRDNR